MCGICGDTHDSGLTAVTAMNAAMVRRGPDDEGTYVDEATGVALGARRLSIIDLPGGHQPLSNEDGSVWAVMNGEIYNHPRLQELLRGRGHTLRSRTDTEVLVHLYEDHGEELVHALEGMYAFAIWDSRRRRLLLARDRLGEKPLFYRCEGDRLQFASELTPLLRVGGGRLDPAALDEFFVLGYITCPGSIVEGIRSLEPAHVLLWDESSRKVEVRRYWSPPARTEPAGQVDPGVLREEVGALLAQSVRSRLLADVPLGVFLSGGLDSTLIAALAVREGGSGVSTFTVGYETGTVSEVDAARRAATALGTDHHELVLSDADVGEALPAMLSALDQPLADQALAPLNAVARLAREHVTVAVGGEGADELFGGYPRYRWLGRAEALQDWVPAAAAVPLARGLAAAARGSRWGRLAEVIAPVDPIARHVDWVTDGRRGARAAVYGPRLRELAGADRTLEALGRAYAAWDGGLDAVGRFMRLDVEHWLPDDVLAKADRAGMVASLEIRTPFLHRELVELALTLPGAVHLRRGGKAVLKEILQDVAPAAAWARSKTAFQVPAAGWLRGRLGDLLASQAEGARLYSEGWFDAGAVRTLLAEHRSEGMDRTSVLWPLLVLGTWYEAQDAVAVD